MDRTKVSAIMSAVQFDVMTGYTDPSKLAYGSDAFFFEGSRSSGSLRDEYLPQLADIARKYGAEISPAWIDVVNTAMQIDRFRENCGEVERGAGARNSFAAALLAVEDAVMRSEGENGHPSDVLDFCFEDEKNRQRFFDRSSRPGGLEGPA